ncbi:MAG: hypothetical protein ACE5LV_02505 [Candidatus Aminicenantales bacterium]
MREKHVNCPSSCPHLSKHAPYQEKKRLERHLKPDLLQDERLAWLAFHIEAPIAEWASKDPRFTDRDALRALELARKRTEKPSVILVPTQERSSQNPVGEAICRSMDACRYEREVILVGEPETYTKKEKLMVLDWLIHMARTSSSEDPTGRRYIQLLQEGLQKIRDTAERKKILTPS